MLNAPQCAVNLCAVLILLKSVPKACRSIAVSLYTLTTTLTNCLMPYLSVKLYTAMGADYSALVRFNLLLAAARGIAFVLLFLRGRAVSPDAGSAISE